MNKDLPVIKKITSIITDTVSPETLILFGSYGRGDNKPDSLKERITTPVDLVAVDYDKYNRLKNESGFIYKTIAKEGRVLYG